MSGVGKTILVTGGGGYVASHCTVGLLQEDFNVIAVDNFVNCIRGEKSHESFAKSCNMKFVSFEK